MANIYLYILIIAILLSSLVTVVVLASSKGNDIVSHITTIENVLDDKSYDLVISLSTKEKENSTVECELKSGNSKLELESTSTFSKRTYFNYLVKNLSQFQSYNYTCTVSSTDSTKEFEFTFPREKGKTKIATFGDWSECSSGEKTLDYLNKHMNKYDAGLLLGDYAYDLHSDDGKVGNNFMEFVMPFTRNIPFMATSGNHEAKDAYENFINRFRLPNKNLYKNLYYSFDINNAHFVSIPSDFLIESKKNITSPNETLAMIEWLKKDLENSNKKWKIVYLHRPPYCSDYSKDTCTSEAKAIRTSLEQIFNDYKVDLVLSGHVHNYERLYPISFEKVDKEAIHKDKSSYLNPKYPSYLICGSAGNSNGFHSKCKKRNLF